MSTTSVDGFTRDRDLVAYLVYKNGRVSQFELRHVHRIKNPAQAVNDAEEQYHFRLETSETLPNGDVPYVLVQGKSQSIEGTIPMFDEYVLEDPDDRIYVRGLDMYECKGCLRHPVYLPVETSTGDLAGVCPRHGPMVFDRVA